MRYIMGLVLAVPLILSGCTTSGPKGDQFIQAGGLTIYSTDNDQKMIFTKDVVEKENHRVCLTPPHDSVSGSSDGVALSTGLANVKEGVSFGKAKSDLSLGGRSPSVLISRELMYRACELSSNLNADLETTLKIYERFLQSLESIAVTQIEQGTAPLSLVENAPVSRLDQFESGNGEQGDDAVAADVDLNENKTPPPDGKGVNIDDL